jgi:hypothetical protein
LRNCHKPASDRNKANLDMLKQKHLTLELERELEAAAGVDD